MRGKWTLAGIPVTPLNADEIYFEVNHDQGYVIDQVKPHVSINNIKFRNEDVLKVKRQLAQPPGITEGVPLDYTVDERGITEVINMYVDLLDSGTAISKDGVNAGIKMLQSLDNANDLLESFTFESLYNETGVKPFTIDGITYSSFQQYIDSHTIYAPNIISSVPNSHDAGLAIFGIGFIATQIYSACKMLAQWSSPSAGLGAVVHVAQLVIEIAYALILIATLISLTIQLVNALIQSLKYHGAMLLTDMLKLSCAKIGCEFDSSIWNVAPYNQIAYLPEKNNPLDGNADTFSLMGFKVGGFGQKGYTSPGVAPSGIHDSMTPNIQHGYLNGTGADAMRLAKLFCNGKVIIKDGTNVLQMERKDWFPSDTPFKMQNIRKDYHSFNTNELSTTTEISFSPDYNDKNCIEFIDKNGNPFYPGTRLQATLQQIQTNNPSMVGLKGLRKIQLPVSRGAAKDRLTFVEKAVQDLKLVWDAITVLEDIGIAAINVLIGLTNTIIDFINLIIGIWNTIIDILHQITNVINDIIDAVDSLGASIDTIKVFNNGKGKIPTVGKMNFVEFQPFPNFNFSNRLDALLLENDMVATPKLLLIDTDRQEYKDNRIGYIHKDNAKVINAQWMLDYFYCCDMFCDTPDKLNGGVVNNRYTKIAPALNSPEEKNRITMSLADFKNAVSNPQFQDPNGETVIAESIQWYPEKSGAADILYRKKGWLLDPENPDPIKRAEQVYNNLKLNISLPNGN